MFCKTFKALLLVGFTIEAAASAIQKTDRLDFTNSGVRFDRRMEALAPPVGGPVSIP